MSQKESTTYIVGSSDETSHYWQDLAVANRRVAEDNQTKLAAAQAEIAALRNFVDNNMTFYDVDADWPVDAKNVPVLAQVSDRIWYHATDDTKSYPFSKVIDAAIRAMKKEYGK